MNKALLTSVFLAAAAIIARADSPDRQSAPAQPASGPTSGFDAANLDKSVRPQDDFYKYVNG